MADFNLSVLIKAVDEASGTFKEIKKNASDFKTEMEKTSSSTSNAWETAGTKMQGVGKSMTSVGTSLTKGVTVPLAGIGVASAKTAMDFETAFAQVQTIMDDSEVSVGSMKKSIIDLSNQTGISAEDISTAAYNAISAGQKTGDSLKFVESSAKLAKAGFTDLGTSTDVLSTIMNAYGLKADQVNSVSDKLITTQNLGKTTVKELGSSIGKVIPTANMYGVSLDNIASAYVTTTKNGISTAESTTYINGMLNELGKSGSTVSEILKDKTGKSFKELMDSGMSLTDVLAIVQKEADDSGKSIGDMFSSQEAGKAAATIIQHAEDFNGAMDEMQKSAGATQSAFDKMDSTNAVQMQKVLNQIKNDGITLGSSLLTILAPAISQVTKFIADLSAKFQALSPAQQNFIVKAGLIVAAVGPVITIVGKLTTSLGGIITNVPKIISAFGTFGGAVAKVGTFITGTAIPAVVSFVSTIGAAVAPFLPLIAIIAAVIAVGVLLWKNWDTVKAKAAELGQWLGEKWTEMKETITNVWTAICQWFTETWNNIKQTFSNAVSAVGNALSTAWTNIKTTVTTVWNAISSFFSGIWGTIKGIFSNAMSAVKNAVTTGLNAIKTTATNIMNGIKTAFTNAWNAIKSTVTNAINGIKSGISSGLNAVKSTASSILNGIKSTFSNVFNGIKSHVSGVVSWLKGIFNFSWSLPHIKLPHFSISDSFSLNPPSIPHFSVSWYKKAYDQAMMFTQPTVMGASGFGDGLGNEIVVGDDHLFGLIQEALAGAGGNITIPVYIGQERIDEIVIRANQRTNYRSGGR